MDTRTLTPEVMDDPDLKPAQHRAALRGLSRLNRFGSASFVFDALRDLLTEDRPLRVLDIATGGGDVPIAMAHRAGRLGMPIKIDACDLSATAIDYARERADAAGAAIDFFQLNVLNDPIPTGYDVVTCSLFLHHLMDRHAVELLVKMAAAAEKRIVVNDVRRSPGNRALVCLGARLLTLSPVVHTDAKRSMDAAFTIEEAARLAERAKLGGVKIEPRFPARYVLVCDKSESVTGSVDHR